MYITDEEIIEGIRANEDKALRALYKNHFGMVNHFILENNGSEQEAKDIYQEAVIHFHERLHSETFVLKCKIKTYLYSVCRRLWLKRLTQKKRFAGRIDDFEKYIPVEQELKNLEEEENDFGLVADCLLMLGEPCRTLIEDFYWSELSMEAIAEKFGYTNADNAKNQKYKCLQRLKKFFFSKYEKQH